MTLFDIAYDDFKREDTTNTIVITLYTDDRQPITPDASHTWKAKVSKEDKYVGEYPVTISGNTIKLSSSNLTRLPNGDYGLELWETYSGSTTIYPSAGVMEFRVHRNANDTLGTVDPTTDINAIIDDLHKAGQNVKVVATNTLSAGSKASVTQSITNGENQLTFNIPQGDKGDKGDVGPAPTLKIGTVTKLNPDQAPTADLTGGNGTYTLDLGIPQGVQGETNATATNALNIAKSVDAKISNLPTSTNIYSNLPNSWVVGTLGENNPAGVDWKQTFISWNAFNRIMPGNNADDVTPATGTITISWADDWKVFLLEYDANKNYIGKQANSVWHTTSPYTVKLTNSTRYIAIALAKTNDSNISPNDLIDSNGNPVVKLKVEQGSMATPFSWCAQDIQTQLDALKEAVKKLGGDNLAPLVAPVMSNVGAETESVTHGHAQRFVLPLKGTELLPKTNILVDVLSGDTLSQSFVIETDATSINGAFTFYMMSSDHHVVPFNIQQLTATKYLVSASYTTENDDKWRILDIMRLNLTGGTYVEFSNPYAAIDLSGG